MRVGLSAIWLRILRLKICSCTAPAQLLHSSCTLYAAITDTVQWGCDSAGTCGFGAVSSCKTTPGVEWRNIAVMVSAGSKLHKHFQDLNESFGKSTCEDLKALKQEKLASDLHAAVAACLHQLYSAALVSMQHHQPNRLWHGLVSNNRL